MGVSRPSMDVIRPAKPDGNAILMLPGGAYQRTTFDKEGAEVAAPMVARGVTAFVLRYRTPGDGHESEPGASVSLADAQRAMRLIRANAPGYGIDPKRVAVMGFSAGGHVAAMLGVRPDAQTYTPVDAADSQSARPDLLALLYPVITMGADAHESSRKRLFAQPPTPDQIAQWSAEKWVDAATPPSFILAADDDPAVPLANSIMFYQALHAAKVPGELHIFRQGDHGFGIRVAPGNPLSGWVDLFMGWAKSTGTFK
jgi:acetyl esterase/lipase